MLILTPTLTLNLFGKKENKNKREVAKVIVEPKSNGIPDMKYGRYATSSQNANCLTN